MANNIFRDEVLQQDEHNQIVLLLPPSLALLSALSAITAIILCVYLWKVEFTKKEEVPGILRLTEKPIPVVANTGGTIKEILVKENDTVKKDQLLAVIVTEGTMIGGSKLSDLQKRQTEVQKASIELSITELRKKIRFAEEQADIARARIATQMRSMERLLKAQFATRHIAVQKKMKAKELYKKRVITRFEYDPIIAEVRTVNEQILSTKREMAGLSAEIPEIERVKAASIHSISEEKAQLTNQLNDITRQQFELQPQRGMELRAPTAGRIGNFEYRAGSLVNAGEVAFYLMPLMQKYQAEIYVPAKTVPFLKQKQKVWITMDGFPPQTYGLFSATIDTISSTAIPPQKLAELGVSVPSFLVRVNLDSQKVRKLDKEYELKDGISIAADVPLTTRKLWDWVAEPIQRMRKANDTQAVAH